MYKKPKKENIKSIIDNKAITMISLIVTIIVLIILAGIVLSMVLGQDGILQKTSDGRNNYQTAKNEEDIRLAGLEEDITNNTGGSADGNTSIPYDNPYIPTNFEFVDGTWNTGFTIKGKTGTYNAGDEFVWVPCVLDLSSVKEGDTVVLFKKTLPETTASSDPYFKYNRNNLLLHPTGGTNPQVEEEDSSVASIRNSVGKYGGFYIAKYEASCPLDSNNNEIKPTASSPITDLNKKPRSVENATPWNNISGSDALTVSKNMVKNSDVNSTLISGECWDTTLSWITETKDSTFATNSTGKGWYNSNSSNKIHRTGGFEVNNIYDMAGNLREWTTENGVYNGSQNGVIRGGYYLDVPTYAPAASRGYCTRTTLRTDCSFRVVIYK